MILATYETDSGNRAIGAVHGDSVFDLAAGAERAGEDSGPFATMISLMEAGEAGLERATSLVERFADDDAG